jgi:hypothetical protein
MAMSASGKAILKSGFVTWKSKPREQLSGQILGNPQTPWPPSALPVAVGGLTTEAALRLGHSVAMLLKRYANCVEGQERAANERILAALEDGGV